MFLTDADIRAALDDGLVIEPFDARLLRPASYVLRLGTELLVSRHVEGAVIDVARPETVEQAFESRVVCPRVPLRPGELALAACAERLSVPPDMVGIIGGLSHLARSGLAVHITSPFVSPGFGLTRPSALTLELSALHPTPFVLHPGMPVCHLFFARCASPSSMPYDQAINVLSGMVGPALGRYHEEFLPFIAASGGEAPA